MRDTFSEFGECIVKMLAFYVNRCVNLEPNCSVLKIEIFKTQKSKAICGLCV